MAATKRSDYLPWDDYFMSVAFLSAKRSKDPSLQLGACIVSPEKKIVGIGYNGMPNGCNDDTLPWAETAANPLDTKGLYVCPAEMNAILNKNASSVKGCTMYVAHFPTNEMAKLIIQSGISQVIYMSDKTPNEVPFVAARKLFDMAGVTYKAFVPKQKTVTIDFGEFGASPSVAPAPTQATAAPTQAKPAPTPAPAAAKAEATTTEAPPKNDGPQAPPQAAAAPTEPSTPVKQAVNGPPEAWFAGEMDLQQCVARVMAAGNGDFLIRAEKDDRVLVVKDETVVRSYTMKADGNGRYLFGGRAYPTLKSIVALLKKTPIKSKTGKMITLGNPAAGGKPLVEKDLTGTAVPPIPQTPGGTVEGADEGCVVM